MSVSPYRAALELERFAQLATCTEVIGRAAEELAPLMGLCEQGARQRLADMIGTHQEEWRCLSAPDLALSHF